MAKNTLVSIRLKMTFFRTNSPRSFSGKSFFDFQHEEAIRIKKEIASQNKDYILSVDEVEYKNYLFEKYKLEKLIIYPESEEIQDPRTINIKRNERGVDYNINGYEFTINYSFLGSAKLFQLSPSSKVLTGHEIKVESSTVSLKITIHKQDADLFIKEKKSAFERAFTNVQNINNDADKWNNNLNKLINKLFTEIKDGYLKENSFFEAIKVKVDIDTKSVFSVPTILKKIIPQPNTEKKEFTSEPAMNSEMYEDTLNVLYDFGRSMERKPSIYKGKNEEDIRDLLLIILETRYDNTTACLQVIIWEVKQVLSQEP